MYPVTYAAQIPVEGRNRLSTFFRYIFAIPALIVAFFFGLGAAIAALIAWFAIVFTGRYPQGLYDFNVKALRMTARMNSYVYLATDEMPPLNGDDDAGYPVRVGVAEPLGHYSRAKTFFRLLVGIPVFLLNYVQQIIGFVVTVIAWFAILFTGKMPEGLVKPLHGSLAYQTKAAAYMLLLTEDYPPFSDDSAVVPAGQIADTRTKV
ncbi:MAG: DUF4389 domain-containing protein [Solirubrobacterales bacterium]